MNAPHNGSRYASAKGPVNRRTAMANPAPLAAPQVRARLQVARARQRLGTPLAHQLSAARKGQAHRGSIPPETIAQAIGGTVGVTGLVLGLIQSSVMTLGASAALLCGVGVWAWIGWRNRHQDPDVVPVHMGLLVDEDDLRRLDASLEKLAAEVPEDTVHRLSELKIALGRCITLMAATREDAGFSAEDQFYLRETVRRYIPDSIAACLRVPSRDRASVVMDGVKPALDLLHDQLDMLQSQLAAREAHLTQVAGEALLRQQRFLASKHKSGT